MRPVRINQENVEVNMRLAKDVYSSEGILLVPQNTLLTANHIVKINLYQIHDIYVYPQEEQIVNKSQIRQSLANTPEFIEFSYKYDRKVEDIQKHLAQIVNTGTINTISLTNLVDDILDSTVSQSQLFSYMCRLKSADDVTYNHSMNVSLLASILGKWLDMSDVSIKELALAGLLHDIGKIMVNQTILNKKGPLTEEEYDHIKQHTTLGYQMVMGSDLPDGIKQAVLMHHEKMNGQGYPLGLKWENIHPYPKIISIVDIYDAMTSERPYHKRFHPLDVIRMFEEECYGLLDTQYLYIFLEHIAHNFIGEHVLLSNGQRGEVIFINKQSPSRPLIKKEDGTILDMLNDMSVFIIDFI
ncbi:HD-GYP domain-containing protein [Petrocella sp. FN5]|uniref:HD-GYP domain-containing protein n=1 Tax=Petrocella sp. FN5 TaxID=3032002 RepID=UPI0023DCC20D|nr:HD-GYP domain-containing protein [Petrocella sp. FN5]MDF1618137.1 HD-GYP domain-containing protein [Petrocella sp. FN5]